ncbi:MAG: HU family DNA-binding protein [Deinococcota bacterium]
MARTSQSRAKNNAADTTGEETRRGSGKIAKTQIVDQVADRTSLSRKQASEAVATILDTIAQALREGKTVGLPGLGTLSVTETAARTGVRPGTSERIHIPAGKKIRFKVATTLKGNL